jgi:hypothetical protein
LIFSASVSSSGLRPAYFLKEKTEKKKAHFEGQARAKSKGSDRFTAGRAAGKLNGQVHCFLSRVKALRVCLT